jgi:hypothetical protein
VDGQHKGNLAHTACLLQLSVNENVVSFVAEARGCRPPTFTCTLPEPMQAPILSTDRRFTSNLFHSTSSPEHSPGSQLMVLFARSAGIH